jgi:hypothetical protein
MSSVRSSIIAATDAADFAAPDVGGVEVEGAEPNLDLLTGPAWRFLSALFRVAAAELFLLIWLLRGKKSEWFHHQFAVAEYVHQHATEDVYVGVALSPADFGPGRRCKAEETAGIVALWVDT